MSEKRPSETAPNPTAKHALEEHEKSVGSAPVGGCPDDRAREAGIHAPLPTKTGQPDKARKH